MNSNLSDDRLIELLFKDSHTAFVLLDRDYTFIRVNDSYARSCGKPVDFFPGKNHFDLYPSNALDVFESVKKSKQPVSISARPFVFPGDPERRVTYWDWNLEPVLDEHGEVDLFVWGIKDVTSRMRAEKERDHYFQLSNNLICAATFEGYFVELSPAWENLLGHSEAELKSKPFLDFVHPEDVESTMGEASKLAAGAGETVNFTNRYRAADDSWRWLSWNAVGDPEDNLIYAVAHDVTDLKQSQSELAHHRNQLEKRVEERSRELSKSQTRLSYLIANSPAVIYTCKAHGDFAATYISDNVYKIFGFTPQRFTSEPGFWASNIHPDDATRVFKDLQKLFEHDHHSHEYRFRKPDGAYIWVHDELLLQRDAAGEAQEIIGYWADITARKEMEDSLQQAKREAQAASRGKSAFLSSMSHELRTPLNAIIGFSQLLTLEAEEHAAEDRAAIETGEEILSAGKHLLNLINDILDLSKIESGKVALSMENISLRHVLSDYLSLNAGAARERGIKVIDNISAMEDFVIKADYTRFKQIVLNLLSNAIKYNMDNGVIRLDREPVTEGRVRVRVTNSGRVIPENKRSKLFQPFERLGAENSEIEGTGIGLVVTKQLVEMMGGRIGYESPDDGHSTFWIELELGDCAGAERGVEQNTDTPLREDEAFAGESRILYIEDNPANIRLVDKIVGKTGHTLLTATNGKSGLELLRRQPPDLVLLDINLPEMSGYDVLSALRRTESARDVPVVAISANATDDDIERGRRAGFDGYLTKPLDVSNLLRTIDSFLK